MKENNYSREVDLPLTGGYLTAYWQTVSPEEEEPISIPLTPVEQDALSQMWREANYYRYYFGISSIGWIEQLTQEVMESSRNTPVTAEEARGIALRGDAFIAFNSMDIYKAIAGNEWRVTPVGLWVWNELNRCLQETFLPALGKERSREHEIADDVLERYRWWDDSLEGYRRIQWRDQT